MLRTQSVLLWVAVVLFVGLKIAITKKSAPCVRIIKEIRFAVQSIRLLCMDSWSPYLTQNGSRVCKPVSEVTWNPLLSQFGPSSTLVHCGSCTESDVVPID